MIRFHPDALSEFEAATLFYVQEASEAAALTFVSATEESVADILQAPERWRIAEEPGIRRYVCRRFPFVLYYRESKIGVTLYAVRHASRKPGYWRDRLG